MLQIFQAQKKIPGAIGAQIASSNQVLTSMGWGVQRGWGMGGGGGLVASQVSAPHETTRATASPASAIPLVFCALPEAMWP